MTKDLRFAPVTPADRRSLLRHIGNTRYLSDFLAMQPCRRVIEKLLQLELETRARHRIIDRLIPVLLKFDREAYMARIVKMKITLK